MAVVSVDGWLAAGKQYLPFTKNSITTVVGSQYSLWNAALGIPSAGTVPTTGVVSTSATAGAPGFTNPTSPALSYLGRVDSLCSQNGTLILYDRLSHMGGLNGTLTTSQTATTATINRGDTTGLNVEGFLEWYTATGATGVTATVGFTDDTNTSRSIAISLPATRPIAFMAPITMTGNSAGVRAVQTVQLSATTGTAGNFGVTLCRRLATISVVANTPISLDAFALGLPRVYDSACLFFAFIAGATSSGSLNSSLILGQG